MGDNQLPPVTHIPLIPFPIEGDLLSVLMDVFPKAGVDMSRVVQAPFATKEISSPTGLPAEEVILHRFVQHLARTRKNLMQDVLLALHYRSSARGFLRMMELLAKELPFLPIDENAHHVLLIEDGGAANAFMRELPTLGVPEDAIATKANFLDGLHKGARLVNRTFGKFFIITWSPTIPNADLGRLLHKWLTPGVSDHLHDGDRHSMHTPAGAYVAPKAPADPRREPSPIPPPRPKSPFEKAVTILGRLRNRS